MNREEIKKFTASLHTHVRSQFDAQIEAKELCEKIKEMGGSGCAITDHGVLSSIEDYKSAFSNSGLKMIPGVELYVDGGILGRLHLVLLAKNDRGYNGICRIVTESNRNLQDGFPVIEQEKLLKMAREYRGDIFALSACMQGVICAIFLQNKKVWDTVAKLKKKQDKYISPEDEQVFNASLAENEAQTAYEKAIANRDEIKLTAEMKFSKREKAIETAMKNGDDVTELLSELNEDKKKAEIAKKLLPDAKNAVTTAKKNLSAATKAKKEVCESLEKWLAYEDQILHIKEELQSDDTLAETAKNVILSYQEAFGKYNFFAELQYHGIKEEAECFPKLVSVAKETGMPFVATNDVHILENTEDERLRRQILRSLRFGKQFEEEGAGDEELYLKDNYELYEALVKIIPEDVIIPAIKNIDFIFDRCNVEFVTDKHYPEYPLEDGRTLEEIFEEEIEKGIKWRFPEGLDEEHAARLKYEVEIIKGMGYMDYFLVEKDFLEYGSLLGYVPESRLNEVPLSVPELKEFIAENGWKNPGLVTGPGRGSAVGSFVCFLFGITHLDPLKYDLLFERFLNPSRVSMPDIDSDFANTTRDIVIKYVKEKYGENAVCGIMTTNSQAPKGAINIAARFYGLKKYGVVLTDLGRTISKAVPKLVGVSFDTIVDASGSPADEGITLYEFLLDKFKNTNDATEVLKWSKIMEGAFTAYGAHAAGIGIMKKGGNFADFIPLRMNMTLGMMTTQCDMAQFEENGFLKFDFLGLKTLDIITQALRLIESDYGIVVDPLKIDLNDKRVYTEILSVGKTNSVFQFESDGMKKMLKRFKPECFEDLIILVSMFRPGPMQYLDDVINVKNGVKPMTFLCPQLEPILGKTYAAIVYQEQVMQICQTLAGYSLGDADNVRRFMSKKKQEKLAAEREAFVNGDENRGITGCVANGISAEVANTLFDQMEEFAKYAFNKSHAAAYAFNAFITAWLKCYYPVEFFCGALNWATNDSIAGLMYEASLCGVEVLAPDVNVSQKKFSVIDGSVRFGLSSVAGVKDNADAIIRERENGGSFESLKDFLTRVNANANVVENLIDAGAFDSFSNNRFAMKGFADEIRPVLSKYQDKLSFLRSATYVLPYVEKFDSEKICNIQSEAGLKLEIKESTTAEKLQKRIDNAKEALSTITKELNLIRIRDCREDKTSRMIKEKELLGIYVTSHPMDFYPTPDEVGSCVVADVSAGKFETCYGVVSDLVIRKRKSDGAEMAFFMLEDRSGSIEVKMFAKAYAKYCSMVGENKVLKLHGTCEEEELEDGRTEKSFIANEAEEVQEALERFVLTIPEGHSIAEFEGEMEQFFIQNYGSKKGHPIIIYDTTADKFYERAYRVKEEATQLPYVTIL